MKLSFLQLNIEEGKRMDVILPYLKEHDFDVIHFQEVTGGKQNFDGEENFPNLLHDLGDRYTGIQAVNWRLLGDPTTYMSNATFFKRSLTPLASHTEFLKPFEIRSEENRTHYADNPTSLLDVIFPMTDLRIHFINTHLVWGPTPIDEPYKLEQGKRLFDYVKSLKDPFVLSGDFNVTSDSQIVSWMSELGVNHSVIAGLTNTLNPETHRVKQLFPEGLAVDFLFTSPTLRTNNFSLVDKPNLSDHFGLSIEIEV